MQSSYLSSRRLGSRKILLKGTSEACILIPRSGRSQGPLSPLFFRASIFRHSFSCGRHSFVVVMSSLVRAIFYFSSFLPTTWLASPQKPNNGESFINGETFDYIIVGGGLTGLVVANRLSEDKSRKHLRTDGGNHILIFYRNCACPRKRLH
jgi:hypothetical protein